MLVNAPLLPGEQEEAGGHRLCVVTGSVGWWWCDLCEKGWVGVIEMWCLLLASASLIDVVADAFFCFRTVTWSALPARTHSCGKTRTRIS